MFDKHLIVPGWRTSQVSEIAITRGVNTAQHVLFVLQVLVSENGLKSHLTAILDLPCTPQTGQQYPPVCMDTLHWCVHYAVQFQVIHEPSRSQIISSFFPRAGPSIRGHMNRPVHVTAN